MTVTAKAEIRCGVNLSASCVVSYPFEYNGKKYLMTDASKLDCCEIQYGHIVSVDYYDLVKTMRDNGDDDKADFLQYKINTKEATHVEV